MSIPDQTRRYVWIDYARFTSIALVVYFHCPPALPELFQTSMNMLRLPYFFLISGLLFRFEKYPTFIGFAKHRARQLLIPYFCFFFIFYTYWLLRGRYLGTEEDLNAPLYQPLVEYLYGRPNLVCVPLWFISCLYTLQCLFYLIFKKIKNRIWAVVLLLAFPFIRASFDMTQAPWMLGAAFGCLPYYGIACLFKDRIIEFLQSKNRFWWAFGCLVVHLIMVWCVTKTNGIYLETSVKIIGSLSIIATLSVVIKSIADKLGNIRFIDYIAANAIIVLACHTYLIRIFTIMVFDIWQMPSDFFEGRYFIKLLMAILVIACTIIPIYLINKYLPFIIGKQKSHKEQAT